MFSPLAYLVLFCLGLVVALPSSQHPGIVVRQAGSVVTSAALTSPTSITTTNIIHTANGPVTETCVLTFTPDGQQVQEVQNCTMSMGVPQVVTTTITPSATPPVVDVAPPATGTPTSAVAAGSSPTAVAAFVIPGRSLQVVPIGLGIFGGITVVTIFVVALVTWERVKYRRAFRQRRSAEQGRSLGYGGTSKGDFSG